MTLLGCTISRGPTASGARLTTPSPNPVDSKAADFRTRLDLLLGEHVIVVAKQSSAARRGDEFTSYLRLLTSNANDLTELVRSALGDSSAKSFEGIWGCAKRLARELHDRARHAQQGKADPAMTNLMRDFVPQYSQFLATSAEIPLAPIEQLVTQHALQTKAMIDDQVAQNYPRLYSDLRIVYAQASRIGDQVAPRIAQKYPDKFPGHASNRAVDLRVTVNNLLQEHTYLTTMATSAAIGRRAAEQAAAVGALGANSAVLVALFADLFGTSAATQLTQIWAARNSAIVAYASASNAAAKRSALTQLHDDFVPQILRIRANLDQGDQSSPRDRVAGRGHHHRRRRPEVEIALAAGV